jgi:hypothetical protein
VSKLAVAITSPGVGIPFYSERDGVSRPCSDVCDDFLGKQGDAARVRLMLKFVLAQSKLAVIVSAQSANVVILVQQKSVVAAACDHYKLPLHSLGLVSNDFRIVDHSGNIGPLSTFSVKISTPQVDLALFVKSCAMSLTRCNLLDPETFEESSI